MYGICKLKCLEENALSFTARLLLPPFFSASFPPKGGILPQLGLRGKEGAIKVPFLRRSGRRGKKRETTVDRRKKV